MSFLEISSAQVQWPPSHLTFSSEGKNSEQAHSPSGCSVLFLASAKRRLDPQPRQHTWTQELPAGGGQPVSQEGSLALRSPAPPGWEECRQSLSDISKGGPPTTSQAGKGPTRKGFPKICLGQRPMEPPKNPEKVFRKHIEVLTGKMAEGEPSVFTFLCQSTILSSLPANQPAMVTHLTQLSYGAPSFQSPTSKISLVLISRLFVGLASVS